MHPFSERLESLGIMGDQLREPPSIPHYDSAVVVGWVLEGVLNWACISPRDAQSFFCSKSFQSENILMTSPLPDRET